MHDFDPLHDAASDLLVDFDVATVDRGSDYADNGHIVGMMWSADELTLTGRCRGSGGHVYDTKAVFTAVATSRTLDYTECSCPVGFMCKHGVALLLIALQVESDSRSDPAELAPVSRLPAQWRTTLSAFVREEPSVEPVPLGILVGLPSNSRWAPHPVPTLRLVKEGKRGRWVKKGVTWRSIARRAAGLPSVLEDPEFEPGQLRAVVAMARAYVNTGVHDDEMSLDWAPNDIWELLADVYDAGVTLLADPSTGATHVDLFSGARIAFRITRGDEGALVSPYLQVDHHDWHDAPVGLIGTPVPHGAFTVDEDVLLMGPFEAPTDRRALDDLVAIGGIVIPDADLDEFVVDMLPSLAATVPVDIEDGAITPPTISGPTPLLTIRVGAEASQVNWRISYRINDRRRVFDAIDPVSASSIRNAEDETQAWKDARTAMELVACRCTRWQTQAARLINQALRAGTRTVDGDLDAVVADDTEAAVQQASTDLLRRTFTYSLIDTAVLVGELVPELGDGIDVDVIGDVVDFRPAHEEPEIVISEDPSPVGNDWLNLRITVEVDGRDVPLGNIIRALAAHATHLLLPDGTYFPLESAELRRLTELIHEAQDLGEIENGLVRRNTYNATLWEELLSLGVVDDQLAEWHSRVRRLSEAALPTRSGPPAGLRADLRDYQHDGLDWLRFLWQNRIGGILADDMGLGKTVQALALIAEASAEIPSGAFLVVAPTSVVGNWVSEAQKFVPDLDVVAVTATEAKSGVGFAEQVGGAQIVVTSYTLLRLQFDEINRFRWSGVIFDEAQFVKNHKSKTHQCARRLGAEMKLAITGTPMENNLMELWSLLSLTAPGLFPSPNTFGEYYRKPIESGEHPERLESLRRRIQPVMLRRTKDQVVADLPAKQEQVLAVELTAKHEHIYQARLNRERQRVLGLLGDWEENRFAIFRSLTMMRQLSLHAGLVDEKDRDVASAKIDHLAAQLPELIAEGHAALVFSQFTGFLGLIRERLDSLGIAYSYLDGSMSAKQRAAAIGQFSAGTTKVFLISLKAGGFGLNLTEADYCFVCDPWWNPAAEAQAVDRAHRIGQTRPVTVYRLVSKGTIEEKVVELQDKKRALFDAVVDDGDLFGTVISPDDVRAMLGDGT
ncbi:DEAD/DEAH box helicase family protein [Gordonia sp. SID5947]|uniref:DEAD/DEAH box helicase n=1 Tax=Gordonia sp. SID5947 TaxID=2690315 RepID=UPI00136EF1ED|nr:DEAD/DEAH box helicase [Gordonia sp. SID5947]MYR07730.1 DEAD/DEAH box helicase family protein [Gordonia sp. SID5947]